MNMSPDKKQDEPSTPTAFDVGQVNESSHDAVFGTITEDGPNYRSVGWLGTAVLMMKTQIGLGVLSIPVAFDALGVVPGVICLCAIAAITTWSDYIIGVFKLRHREVYGIDDVGELLLGKPGRIVLGGAFVLWWIFVAGSGMLGVSIGLNAVSSHATCTAVYVAVAAILGFLFGMMLSTRCIQANRLIVLIVTVAVGIEDRPSAAPQDVVWVPDYEIVKSDVSFTDAITAVSSLVFAFAGTPAFFSIASEMREPRHYNRSLIICQSVVTGYYLVIGIVIYYFCGSYVSSPALGSAGPTIKIVSYGFALPGLIVSTLLFVHITAKYIFVRILGNSRHLVANTVIHWAVWLGCTLGTTIIAYIIASAIPVFSDLVSLVGALLGTPMCFQPMAGMWLYDNWGKGKNNRTTKWFIMVAWCAFIIAAGTFLMIGGTYGSIVTIMNTYKESGGSAAWSCADNSSS
ncbi:hypothetical protein N7497_010667 [Penicillium chrysogenum]|uniref:Amino acid transporter transmembrane domain-containing protein n=2 Tax=Penicillium chrysogenum TaxID=5076 RepID=A0ABQ8WFV0_PENCH|nr:hypothetical protein N7524_006308 [Penicillium chrysogenum]KAJ5268606.1 hypothetical protein N7505_004364 [Penicillium chrysogenum]KAJ6148685.1 hypothetical protein N7497_010667 [Penicillium chrysogenum]